MSDCKCKKEENIGKKNSKIKELDHLEIEYIEEGIFDEAIDDTPDIEYSSWIQTR